MMETLFRCLSRPRSCFDPSNDTVYFSSSTFHPVAEKWSGDPFMGRRISDDSDSAAIGSVDHFAPSQERERENSWVSPFLALSLSHILECNRFPHSLSLSLHLYLLCTLSHTHTHAQRCARGVEEMLRGFIFCAWEETFSHRQFVSSFRLNQLIRISHFGCPLSGSRFDRRTFADVEGTLSSVDHRPSTQVVGCLRHSPVQFKESLA